MKLPHEQFCVLPWISLEASPIGTVRPCCLADEEITDDQGKKFSLTTARLDEVVNGIYMKNLRQQFLNSERPQTCRKCWNEERSGRTSKRMHTLDRLKHMIDDGEWTSEAKPLLFIDFKLGNICNLKCRICGSWSSSQFATEELNDLGLEVDRKNTFAYQMLRAGSWPRDNPLFWDQIADISDGIRYLEFTGGEPFMIQEHFDFLQGLVDRGISHQIEIHYNTNGTHFPEQACELWKNFRLVEIALSLDDLGERFEYQRTNAQWSEVYANLQRFQQLRATAQNIQLQVCCTVNVFNVYYLPEFATWVDTQQFDFVYWNMMHDAWYFSIATLPDDAKQRISQHLTQSDVPKKFRDEFARIQAFMMAGASTDGFMLRLKIRDLDRKRKQNMAMIEPELAKIYGYDYDHQ